MFSLSKDVFEISKQLLEQNRYTRPKQAPKRTPHQMGRLRLFGFFGHSCFAIFAGLWWVWAGDRGIKSFKFYGLFLEEDYHIDILKDAFWLENFSVIREFHTGKWSKKLIWGLVFQEAVPILWHHSGFWWHFSSLFIKLLRDAATGISEGLRPAKYQPRITPQKDNILQIYLLFFNLWFSIVMLLFGGVFHVFLPLS